MSDETNLPEGWETYPAGDGHVGARKWFGDHWKQQVVPVGNDLKGVLEKIEDEVAGALPKTDEENEIATLNARIAELEAEQAPPVEVPAFTVVDLPSDHETLKERQEIAAANEAEAKANPTDPQTGEPLAAEAAEGDAAPADPETT